VLCAVLCRADDFVGMGNTFAEARAGWLRTSPPSPGGILGHDTFGRAFAAPDPGAFRACFPTRVQAVVPSTAGQVVALDCKALHLIRARASESRLIVGQVAVAGKSTEITTIPALIGVPDLAGATMSASARSATVGVPMGTPISSVHRWTGPLPGACHQ
jgi:hypothetical protein